MFYVILRIMNPNDVSHSPNSLFEPSMLQSFARFCERGSVSVRHIGNDELAEELRGVGIYWIRGRLAADLPKEVSSRNLQKLKSRTNLAVESKAHFKLPSLLGLSFSAVAHSPR